LTRNSRSRHWLRSRAPSARAGAEALIEISTRYGMRRGAELLSAWLDRRGLTD
jgi:hypothetical protein